MRGKVPFQRSSLKFLRITPAYAGKSHTCEFGLRKQEDHPRLCGEKFGMAVPATLIAGITPAYAGKRLSAAVV